MPEKTIGALMPAAYLEPPSGDWRLEHTLGCINRQSRLGRGFGGCLVALGAVAALASLSGAAAGNGLDFATWVLDSYARDDASDEHQQAGDADAEVKGRGRGISGSTFDADRLRSRQRGGVGDGERLGLGIGDRPLG